ncbi:MAG: acylphosphatase [Gaiellaceae bacterium]
MIIHGRVQGVFFRSTLLHQAELEGVAGWAQNKADGTVEAVFEGDRAAVDRLVATAGEGPPAAQVERVDVVEEEPEGLIGFHAG